MTLSEVLTVLHGRGLDVLVILMALPFCTPIPLPGLSTPFGLALMFLGLRIALRQRPWLPRRLLMREIPHKTLTRIIEAALTVSSRLERILHPRLQFFKHWTSFIFLNGLMIMSSAFILLLPIPVPFTNTFPALSIVLLAAGMIEEDGAAILAGYILAGGAWAYIFFLWWMGKVGIGWLGF